MRNNRIPDSLLNAIRTYQQQKEALAKKDSNKEINDIKAKFFASIIDYAEKDQLSVYVLTQAINGLSDKQRSQVFYKGWGDEEESSAAIAVLQLYRAMGVDLSRTGFQRVISAPQKSEIRKNTSKQIILSVYGKWKHHAYTTQTKHLAHEIKEQLLLGASNPFGLNAEANGYNTMTLVEAVLSAIAKENPNQTGVSH